MKGCLYVGLGGAVGSVFRYLIGLIPLNSAGGFPVKTLLVNILGSFFIGLIAAVSGKHARISPDMLLLLKTGVCGGFTTFSTFALETSALMESGRVWSAALYVAASVLVSLLAIGAAQLVVR